MASLRAECPLNLRIPAASRLPGPLDCPPGRRVDSSGVKKLLELVVCLFHPIAVILMWIDLASRPNMGKGAKLAWAIFGLIPLVPFLYVLTGGDLW
jgi:hypothetical protein